MKTDWKLNPGRVPPQIKEGTLVEVIHNDGTKLRSNDFDHKDLWVPDASEQDPKGIQTWRLV
jgi:hypothetical protein